MTDKVTTITCVNLKMLSTNSNTSWPSTSRKYSATVSPVSATRARAPGGSFIWPYTRVHLESARCSPSLITPYEIEQTAAAAAALDTKNSQRTWRRIHLTVYTSKNWNSSSSSRRRRRLCEWNCMQQGAIQLTTRFAKLDHTLQQQQQH